jgi:uncharacterized protein YqfA (UPF0365 family)
MTGDPTTGAIAIVALGGLVLVALVVFFTLRLWVLAHLSNTPVTFSAVLGMGFRRCPPKRLVLALFELHQRGARVPARELEAFYRAERERGEPIASATDLAQRVEASRGIAPQS